MRRLLTAMAMVLAVPCLATTPCAPPTDVNVYISYAGPVSGCSSTGAARCRIGEPIRFEAKAFGYSFCADQTFAWNFGDGSAGHTSSVTHVYAQAGFREVRLLIRGAGGELTLKTTMLIDPIGDPPPPLSYWPVVAGGVRLPRAYRFETHLVPGPWSWSFGDGTILETPLRQVEHRYARGGRYVVTLVHLAGGQRYAAVVDVPFDRARAVRH